MTTDHGFSLKSGFTEISCTPNFPLVKRVASKSSIFLRQKCFVHLVTITTGFCYSNWSCLKKLHYLDLVCSAYVVTMTTGLNYSKRSSLKKWHLFLFCLILYRTEEEELNLNIKIMHLFLLSFISLSLELLPQVLYYFLRQGSQNWLDW